MKFSLLFVSLFMSFSAMAAQRVAERYTCTAYNPLTGFATITYSEKGRGKAKMTSIVGEKQIRGGRLTYNTGTLTSFPRATFSVPVNGSPVSVYMDLTRPLKDDCEGQLSEDILTGFTYIPLYGATTSYWPFVALTGNPFLPVPLGFIPTSMVTCRVIFR